ncbi:glycosyl transferase [Lactococcus garvieae subsp. garvieae]|uniref:stealth family protein n=1 Tax=Lactococcus garvieae TaxID=1363 RepID=UPI0005A8C847|nr:stealth family protein [Lactococcus garvieae]KAA8719127.1 glycosyl transferase [Lactococcus garvieae subsp. garvieae]MDG6190839.1 stealth family protein [Lactococcus garvieae]PCS03137.1 glycosyltransferase [Lactococcus garvieae]QPR49139.1 glycosyl transferase [Lactococcus garvieae]
MEKIDIVVSWLDDSDPKWQADFSEYRKKENLSMSKNSANNASRFRDYDTFRYWFRGIEKNAPWINKIYLVTYGHSPEWLNLEHPKLQLMKHEDFIPKEFLPTFSSVTIAMNLHRIPGLSENFVYFNDDMFLINPTKTTDFFKEGIPCDMLTLIPCATYEELDHLHINNMNLIHRKFTKQDILKKNLWKMINFKTSLPYLGTTLLQLPYPTISYIIHFHLATPLNKSMYEKLWEEYPQEFTQASTYKFRNINGIDDWFIRLYSLCSGNFVPKNMYKFGRFFKLNVQSNVDKIVNSKLKLVCLNDNEALDDEELQVITQRVKKAMEIKFPQKSNFEK